MSQYDFLMGEQEFARRIHADLAVFRQEHYKEGMILGIDNTMRHYTYVRNEKERGAIVISHGFCEFLHKYDEMIYYFYQLGYSIYFMDHLGHGLSHRLVEESGKVHAVSFDTYVEDLKLFVDQVVKEKSKGPLFLFAHSMGGAIGAGVLERYPMYFKAAVLCAPMMRMDTGKVPAWAVSVIAWVKCHVGKSTDYIPSKHGFDNVYAFPTSSALSEPRYAYVFKLRQAHEEFQTYGASCGWMLAAIRGSRRVRKEASKVKIPVLLCQAGMDTMVEPKGQELFARRASGTRLLRFPSAKHEIFNALEDDRNRFYNEVFEFYKENL